MTTFLSLIARSAHMERDLGDTEILSSKKKEIVRPKFMKFLLDWLLVSSVSFLSKFWMFKDQRQTLLRVLSLFYY